VNNESNSDKELIDVIKQTFNHVNNKIEGLIACSTKDFIVLNNIFKNYHRILGNLTDATKGFLKFILSSKEDIIIREKCDETIKYSGSIKLSIKSQLNDLKELNDMHGFILLSISNIKQNVSTIRLLFANLRFDPSFKIEYKKINSCFDNLIQSYNRCETYISTLYDKLTTTIDLINQEYINELELFIYKTEKISSRITYFETIRKSSVKHQNQLEEIELKKTLSTSEIITNLQFQDILQQKIEHIQSAHKEITENLYSSHKANNPITIKEISQIRDIGSLQSAQLIHSNQEYQSAVENILRQISVLKQVVNNYYSIWNNFCAPEKAKFVKVLSKIREEISIINSLSLSINHISEKYKQNLTEITSLYAEIDEQCSNNLSICQGISNFEDIIRNVTHNSNSEDKYSPILQLKTELNKFQKAYSKLTDLLKSLKDKSSTIRERNNSKVEELSKYSENLVNLMNSFFDNMRHNTSAFDEPINTNTEFSVDQVEYYKIFDKEVKEIITYLDRLLEKININQADIDPENLNHLQNMYTMQSERDVHDELTKSKKVNNKSKENDIEFFN
jgi:hypothetical protein